MRNRTELVNLAAKLANQSDSIETDIIAATDEDDLQAILSHLEILERQAAAIRSLVREALEHA